MTVAQAGSKRVQGDARTVPHLERGSTCNGTSVGVRGNGRQMLFFYVTFTIYVLDILPLVGLGFWY